MEWASRLRQSRLRRLYRSAASGQCDDELLQDVGWSLYARCEDVVAVSRGLRLGEVPCPTCRTVILRRNARLLAEDADLTGRQLSGSGWFHCDQCSRLLLWTDCREALRSEPRCFDCHALLTRESSGLLTCRCGKVWPARKYEQSVARRLWLPCPSCAARLRRPEPSQNHEGSDQSHERTFPCPKCHEKAEITQGLLKCRHCGHERRWGTYWKSLK